MIVQVSMNQQRKAIDWLEAQLEEDLWMFDTDDIKAMVEAVTAQWIP